MGAYCDEHWDRNRWSFQAQVVLTLLPAINGVEPVTRNFTHTFEEQSRGWGYSEFVEFGSLSTGYITDGGDISVKMDIVPQGIKYGTAREHGKKKSFYHSFSDNLWYNMLDNNSLFDVNRGIFFSVQLDVKVDCHPRLAYGD